MTFQELIAALRGRTEEEALRALSGITDAEAEALAWDWPFWARPEQVEPPGEWDIWLILSGRGWGKTRTGSEQVRTWAKTHPGCRIALVGATAADVRDTMIEGESGLLAICPPWEKPHYEPSKRRLTWPNGSLAQCFSAEEPGRLRGPQFHFAWADELAAWTVPEGESIGNDSAWQMLQFCMRLGKSPRIVVTTTPKPTPLIVKLATKTPRVHVTEGHTFDNAFNLAGAYVRTMKSLYAGTRLGQQELAGKLLLDTPGALFRGELFEECAVKPEDVPTLEKTIVAVDPQNSSNEGNDHTGISVLGLGEDKHVYGFEDATIKGSPHEWAQAAVDAYYRHQASYIVAETNTGGEMVETTIHTIDPNVPVRLVRAMKGKAKRAEPVAAALEQRKIHLVHHADPEHWAKFLHQAKRFDGKNGKKDDRVDSFNWGVHDLLFSDTFIGLV